MSDENLQPRLKRLPPRLQAAFAAACAERVLPIYADTWGGDDSYLRDALALVWRYAAGEDIDLDTAAEADEVVLDRMPSIDEDNTAWQAARAVSFSLNALADTDGEAANAAHFAAIAAIMLHEGESGEGEEAQDDWAERLLARLESWPGKTIARGQLLDLLEEEQIWMSVE
jgi:hypothetical protein